HMSGCRLGGSLKSTACRHEGGACPATGLLLVPRPAGNVVSRFASRWYSGESGAVEPSPAPAPLGGEPHCSVSFPTRPAVCAAQQGAWLKSTPSSLVGSVRRRLIAYVTRGT